MATASVIIDGYNLTGTIAQNLEKIRERLIDDLCAYNRLKRHDLMVVFDGYKSNLHQSWGSRDGIEVVYSGHGEDADTLIKRIIKTTQKHYIVVSTDKDLAAFVWANNCVPVRAEVFIRKMKQALHSGKAVSSGDDIYDSITFNDEYDKRALKSKKGNSVTLSKKEKIIRSAVDKL
ncbi:MAG: NYN domain-containing protein [Nitrospirae bacterium YQR-1]